MATTTGVCKFFNAQRGFGFITPDGGGEDLFVHQNNIKMEGFRSLCDGEPVEFLLEKDPTTGKQKAVNVTGPGGNVPQGAKRPQKGKGKGGFNQGKGGFNQGFGGGKGGFPQQQFQQPYGQPQQQYGGFPQQGFQQQQQPGWGAPMY